MSVLADAQPRKLDIGRVLKQTFGVLGQRPVMIFGLALVLSGLPYAFLMSLRGAEGPTTLPGRAYWTGLLIFGFLSAFLQACLFSIALGQMGGRKVEFSQAMARGGAAMLPLLAVNILVAIGVMLGTILLIVPGIMLSVAWCVAAPSVVAERGGVIAAFGRSADLTRGNRWRIVGLFVVYFIALIIPVVIFEALAAAGGGGSTAVGLVSGGLSNGLTTSATAVLLVVLYTELRTLKGGLGSEEAAKVFD